MDDHSKNFNRDRECKKVPSRSHNIEEHNYLTEKYPQGVQKQRKDLWAEDRVVELTQRSKEKIFKKGRQLKEPIEQHQTH